MPHFIYILQSHDGRYYTGYTTDLGRRLKEHRSGLGAKFTRAFGAKKILYHESYQTKSAALKREAEIKCWPRTQKEKLISHPALRRSFPPSISPNANILILGSMPGERSLREQQYYAHPHNIFWDIMGDLFEAGRNVPYAKRLQILKKNRVGLWDVACQCHRKGSLDADIHMASVVPNDFVSLFSSCRQIETIFFNGHKAEQLFRKLVLKNLLNYLGGQSLRFERLPSTSPAHASLTKEQKKARWRRALMPLAGNF